MKPVHPVGLWAAVGLMALMSFASSVFAENSSKQIWLDYNPWWQVSPKVQVGGDAGYRTSLETGGWHRLVLRPGVSLPVRYFTLRAGLGNFWTISDDIDNRWEIRPYQGAHWVWPRSRVIFDHMVRLEERFDLNTVDWSSENSVRVRYRLRARYLFAQVRPDRFWRTFGSGEAFVKLAGTEGVAREQFRVTLGMERSFSLRQRYRFEVTWQKEELFFLPTETAEEIYFRFRVYQNF